MATKWIRSDAIVWEELNGEAVLVSQATGDRWSLNTAAAEIWKACDGTRGLCDLARGFARASGRSVTEATRDIAEFCERFTQLGLLHTSASPALATQAVFRGGLTTPPRFQSMSVGSGARRRPSPRGNSGPG